MHAGSHAASSGSHLRGFKPGQAPDRYLKKATERLPLQSPETRAGDQAGPGEAAHTPCPAFLAAA